ncbi:fibronectin-III type domain-containing protein windei isoform X2 [Megalopta genalis]|uniref:fibronectin-III type domain-containing protein windei isoform X2 n=1 Tax=Megalopta genalis TaxID=115081 RepID=UPI0014432651|nr:activating transcription factor 7-interacting protein 1 isoform X2 [Megalopta genalis]
MEALRSKSVHSTDSIRSLSCINAHHIDELSKEKEDELLYGGDDGDEEDALSDDSMRLRLSDDDEAEPDDILTSVLDDKEHKPKNIKIDVTCGGNEDVQDSPVPEKNEMKSDTTPSRERKEEEHCSDANLSSRTVADTSIKDENCANKNEIEKYNDLVSKTPISSEQNNDDLLTYDFSKDISLEDLEKDVTDINRVNDPLGLENETKSVQENSAMPSNNKECKNNTFIDINTTNESSNGVITCPSQKSQHENKEGVKEEENIDTGNAQFDCNGSQDSSNFNTLATLLTENRKNLSNNEDVEFIELNDENNKKDNAIVNKKVSLGSSEKKVVGDCGLTSTQHCIEITEMIEVIEHDAHKGSTVNNALAVTKKVESHKKEILTDKDDVFVQDAQSNTIVETHTPKTNDIILNDQKNREGSKETEVKQNNTIFEPFINGEKCDKARLNDSDNSTNTSKLLQLLVSDDHPISTKLQERNNTVTKENVKSVKNESPIVNSSVHTEKMVSILDENNVPSVESQNDLLGLTNKVMDNDVNEKKVEVPVNPVNPQRRRRRTKKMIAAAQEAVSEEDKQVRESGRQKRKTAKNAEEIIRKKFLNHDSDLESSDSSEKFVIVNHKVNEDVRSLSPPSLKRNCSDLDNITMNGSIKKIKVNTDSLSDELSSKENDSDSIKQLDYVNKFFQRDLKEKLPKLKQEELEDLLIQKIVETITMRGEIGKLREQARISERNQEVTRAKCQQLTKQIKDFEMVLSRNAADRRANNDKPVPPIKINRSVGLQVNFITDHGMQCLRQMQPNANIKSANISSNSNTTLNTPSTDTNNSASPRRGIKIRPPRRIETVAAQNVVVSQSHTQSPNIVPTITPAALVVAKPVEAQHPLQLPNQSNVQQIMSNSPLPPQQPQQTIVLNGKFTNQLSRQNTTVNIAKPRANDLIDLTDEEEKSKGTTSVPIVTTTITDQQINLAQKAQPCFQRVIQTIPGNVAITNQPPSIRVVQPASQPTPTALVNNMSAPRLAYVMQSGVGPTRLLQIAPNSATIRPVTSCNRTSFPTLTYKTGISTVANGTVRVLTTSAPSNIQLNKHPAPLPDTRNHAINPLWKLPPPAPSLKISKVANGIVLSWNMNLSDKYADIVSYQLYAYQEVAGIPPSTSSWKKVGDVRALPLPMACTLTQFSEGNNYYFAVRAVDTHSRKGQYSTPGNISL